MRRVDLGLDVADARGGVDELLIELAPVFAERLDFALELGLAFRRLALLGARGVEFLIVLLERVRIGRRRRGAVGAAAALERRRAWAAALAGLWRDGSCASAAKLAPNGSANAKAEPSTRRGSVRLDRRRIIVFKVDASLRKARESTAG